MRILFRLGVGIRFHPQPQTFESLCSTVAERTKDTPGKAEIATAPNPMLKTSATVKIRAGDVPPRIGTLAAEGS